MSAGSSYYCAGQFQTDLAKLTSDAAKFERDKAAWLKEKAETVKEAEEHSGIKGDPAALLIFLIVHVYGGKADSAFQMHLKTEADAVQMQADLSKLSNDINNQVNEGGNETIIVDGKKLDKGIVNVAAELDEMQKILGSSTDKTSTQYALNDALGSASCSLLKGNFANMRESINWTSDPNASTYNTGTNCDFDPDLNALNANGQAYIHSFKEMNEGMKEQGNTMAQNGYKTFLDNYNTNVSATQSLGTAANAEIGLITSKIKSLISFISVVIQNMLTGNRTAIKDQVAQ